MDSHDAGMMVLAARFARQDADRAGLAPAVSACELLGTLLAGMPDAVLQGMETRGEGLVATVAYGGERWRIQLDALRERGGE